MINHERMLRKITNNKLKLVFKYDIKVKPKLTTATYYVNITLMRSDQGTKYKTKS